MSIAEFGTLVQSEIFKKWLNKLDKNIVSATVKDIRAKEQLANKTDFIISAKDIKAMYKTITGAELSGSISRRVLRDIARAGKLQVPVKVIRVSGSGALYFESIGFDTISTYVTSAFDGLAGVQEAYSAARDAYTKEKYLEISKNPKLTTGNMVQTERDKADSVASKIGLGYFFHKGHVVSIATNSTKNVYDSIEKANEFTDKEKALLLGVLDKYISKMQKDDLASSNLYGSVDQKLYAKYTKSSSKYLVEFQLKTDNMDSGSASLPIANELRKVFSTSGKDLEDILTKSPQLGKKLIETKGSPSYIDLLTTSIVETLNAGRSDPKLYSLPLTEVSSYKRKVVKTTSSKQIATLKALKQKVQKIPKVKQVSLDLRPTEVSLASLQALLDAQLQHVVAANMGNGDSKNTLNFRTGRLASSAKVQRLSQSREGMITAFYSYMRNPYGTFSEGGQQQYPKTRDPKLLISTSIKEIMAQKVSARMRAVLI